jgi:hypothetical protein
LKILSTAFFGPWTASPTSGISGAATADGRPVAGVVAGLEHVLDVHQRPLRLRTARQLIAQGRPIAAAAAQAGFSDQAHLTRWFIRCYGITPGGYQRAALHGRS